MRHLLLIVAGFLCSISPVFAQTMKEANAAYRNQKYDRAIEIYDALLAKSPDDARVRSQRAHALVERAELLQSSGQLGPDNYATMQRDAQQAVDELTAAITARNGGKAISQTWRGRAYLLMYKLDEAMADLNSALEQKPDRATAYYYRGLVNRYRGKPDEAFADFHLALQYKPEDALAFRERAKCQQDAGLDQECVPVTKGNLTWIEQKIKGIKDPDKITCAKADYERALAVDPEDCESRRALVNLHSLTGDAKSCLEQLDELAKRQPDNVCTWCTRSWIQGSHNNPEFRNGPEAVKAAKKSLELSKNRDSCLLMNLASAHAEAGEFQKAITVAKEAIQALTADKQFATPEEHPCGEKYLQQLQLFKKKQPYRDPNLQDFSKK